MVDDLKRNARQYENNDIARWTSPFIFYSRSITLARVQNQLQVVFILCCVIVILKTRQLHVKRSRRIIRRPTPK